MLATVIAAWGSKRAHVFKPKSRTDKPMIHKLNGGLSTVMELPQSEDPKKNAAGSF
ncbi:hypothetical protein GCM10009589_24040 [Arthrobacter pascens]